MKVSSSYKDKILFLKEKHNTIEQGKGDIENFSFKLLLDVPRNVSFSMKLFCDEGGLRETQLLTAFEGVL